MDSRDPRRGGRSFIFDERVGIVRADRLEDVLPTLRSVEAAVADGLHAVGLVAYEAAPAFDSALAVGTPDSRVPLAYFGLFRGRREQQPRSPRSGSFRLAEWMLSLTEADYYSKVERIREWTAAGHTYQVNFSFRLRASFGGDELAFYEQLCRSQSAAFCALLRLDGISILSASPELFFRWAGRDLEMRPMKGTRPRGRWADEDRALAAELLASPKERAENLMIVDLLRNDAGRIAEWGSVQVPRLFEVESYETVHQMTSTIRARTRNGVTLPDLFRALFPCGSVTGAPKVRTSQIIAELEDSPRGAYTGAIGFVSPDEAMFSVAIRTVMLDHASGTAELGVGSGITFDSEPAAEYRECLAKAAFVRHRHVEIELLETILLEPSGEMFLLEGHLNRMAASAERFDFVCDPDRLREMLLQAAQQLPGVAYKLRLLLSPDGTARIEHHPLAPEPNRALRVAVAREPVNSHEVLLYHKTSHRALYEARAASRPDCDEVLLVNERGELTEATMANLVVQLDGTRWTPPAEAGLLPGVFRDHLLARGEIRERSLWPADLASAECIYLINSVRKWRVAEMV